ncbi:hypothetical protein [Methylobacterium sp. J-076]|uniref:hypothetical protein n=1 Tax=Methylobacterium sp. J-076 TaxID=2836655 RepID=UPI001FB8A7F7|nr:hypothetical protein [Methylobacterium sp. J-076]MCJ2011681.1 hypothetical protein [Methylobacterium sp. J-076]
MSADHPDEHTIIEELAAIFRRARGPRAGEARHALFESLAELERRAGLRGASDGTLGRVSESRFLAGLLRESVSPIRTQTVRATRQLLTACPDPRTVCETVAQA